MKKLSVLFMDTTIEIKEGKATVFKGNRPQALKSLTKFHKAYILDNCEKNIEGLLKTTIQGIINETLENAGSNSEDIYEYLTEIEIVEKIESCLPCVTVVSMYINPDNLNLHFMVILLNKEAIFKIGLTATDENKIDFKMKKGKISFNGV